MSEFRCTLDSSPAGWDDFVRRVSRPSELLQSWAWGEFQAAAGKRMHRLALSDGAGLRAVCLLVLHVTRLGKSWLLSPRGPLLDPTPAGAEQERAWTALLSGIAKFRDNTTMFLKVEPNLDPPKSVFLEHGSGMHPGRTLFLDLRKSEQELLDGMHQKARYNLRLAERKGVVVRFSRSSEDVEAFLRLLRETAERQRIGIFPPEYYRVMLSSLGENCEVALAEHGRVPLAGALHVRFGDTVTYLHGASSEIHRELMAPYQLHWQAILRAKHSGYAWYDFFGIAPEGAANHRWAGITRFKLGFGGTTHAYPGAFNYVYMKNWYLAYRLAKRIGGR